MNILIVDDKPENSYLLESLLKGYGYETIIANNGVEALDFLSKYKFGLIISDILMPVMDGFTFCRECKKDESLKKIPFIFYTATYTSYKDEEFALSLGADKFILKPQDLDVFINIINEVLRDVKEDKFQSKAFPSDPEDVILKEYNSTLIRKLEDKMEQAEEAAKELKAINFELKKEIEERKRSEMALRISEEKFRITFEDASVGMSLTTLDGRFILVNNALTKMLGYTKDELINKQFIDFTHKDDINLSLNWMEEMVSGETRLNRFEKRFIHKNGNPVFVDVNLSLIRDSNNSPLFFVAHLLDMTERKLAEEKINMLASIVESSDDAIISKTLDGIITSWNHGAEKIYGYKESEVIGTPISMLSTPEKKDEVYEILEKIKSGLHIQNYETERIRKDGKKINVSLTVSPVKNAEGKIVAISTIAHDITERKLTEAELRESEERFRMVFENVFDGISLYAEDPDPSRRKLVDCNEQYAKMTGRSREELLRIENTLPLQKVIENSSTEVRMNAAFSKAPFQGYFSWIRPDGKENIIEYVGMPITWKGKPYTIGMDRDITERRQSEKKMLLLAHSIRSVSECISITDKNDNIIFVNEAFIRTFGYTEEELLGKNIKIVRPEDAETIEQFKDILPATISGGWKGEIINQRKDGTKFPVLLSTSVIKDDIGNPIALIGISTDITEMNKAREELLHAKEQAEISDKLKTEFLAQMSHEIRTPMNAIICFTDLLEGDFFGETPKELLEVLEDIGTAGKRIIRTVELILNASEMHIGSYEPTFKSFDLGKKIMHVIQYEYSALARRKGLQVTLKNDLSSTDIYGDEYSINQIFINLIDNAVKFTETGTIDVLIDKDKNDNIFATVSDTGIGIAKEYMPFIFEPFIQEEHGYSRKYEGNGLGLSLVKRYCDLNGITISVESEKGTGSKFTVTFINHLNH